MIFQHFNLLMQKSVLENICFPLYIQGKRKGEARKRSLELLKIVGFEDKTKAYPAKLAGGQKQRVAIARALASDPKILLCDEATSALAPQITSSILKLLEEINRNLHITIVIITHQMSVVRKICTKVAILKDGEVVEKGSVEEIFNNPKSQVAKELILIDGSQQADLKPVIQSGDRVRIVFSENLAFEPVIANMILKFHEPVNILKADTKNVGGVAKGEMILEFPGDSEKAKVMKQYLKERGLPMGVPLAVSDKEGLRPNRVLYRILDVIANIVRSIPFLILLILLIPFTRMIVGKSYGSTATVVPLVIAAGPFIARMVESSLNVNFLLYYTLKVSLCAFCINRGFFYSSCSVVSALMKPRISTYDFSLDIVKIS